VATALDGFHREQLLDRRSRLAAAARTVRDADPIEHLLRDVDAALARLDAGTYGLCETCHDPIEPARLIADPLTRLCLDHLTPGEQRALEQDLDLSGRIQGELLPARRVSHGDWEVAYHYEPRGPVSGDYCDLIARDDGDLLFLVGDVAGKGVAASLLMTHLHALFRGLGSLNLPLPEMMLRANRIFCESTGGQRYATLVCGRAAAAGIIELCIAGHLPPLHIHAAAVTPIQEGGVPLGLFCGTPYPATAITLQPGESLVICTDGVTETEDRTGAEYGIERLGRMALAARGRPVGELVERCVDDLIRFRDATPARDDVTLFALRRTR
jgi:phosphoserine phosphatase RsbU/P